MKIEALRCQSTSHSQAIGGSHLLFASHGAMPTSGLCLPLPSLPSQPDPAVLPSLRRLKGFFQSAVPLIFLLSVHALVQLTVSCVSLLCCHDPSLGTAESISMFKDLAIRGTLCAGFPRLASLGSRWCESSWVRWRWNLIY